MKTNQFHPCQTICQIWCSKMVEGGFEVARPVGCQLEHEAIFKSAQRGGKTYGRGPRLSHRICAMHDCGGGALPCSRPFVILFFDGGEFLGYLSRKSGCCLWVERERESRGRGGLLMKCGGRVRFKCPGGDVGMRELWAERKVPR